MIINQPFLSIFPNIQLIKLSLQHNDRTQSSNHAIHLGCLICAALLHHCRLGSRVRQLHLALLPQWCHLRVPGQRAAEGILLQGMQHCAKQSKSYRGDTKLPLKVFLINVLDTWGITDLLLRCGWPLLFVQVWPWLGLLQIFLPLKPCKERPHPKEFLLLGRARACNLRIMEVT